MSGPDNTGEKARAGLISIVIPALNEERLLPDCLRSLREQDYGGQFEIIVADNGSTDRTREIARKAGAKVVSCTAEQSVFYARQAGAEAAGGEVIIQADADTVYPRHWLKKIARQFAAHPKAAAVAGRFVYRDPPFWAHLEYFLRYLANFLAVIILGRPLVISGATFAFRRQAFLAGDGYRGLAYSADQYGIARRLSRFGSIIYDHDIRVVTSARSVRKPFGLILLDFARHLRRWSWFTMKEAFAGAFVPAAKTAPRRKITRFVPLFVLFAVFIVYGYFIPQSPVFGKVFYEGKPLDKAIALTFDDGPNEPYTSQILDILAARNVKATFFVVGKNVEHYPETARRIIAEGSVVGNHSYSHMANHALTASGYKDLLLAQQAIYDVINVWPHLYRPPHGKKSPWELRELKKKGLVEVTWSVSTNDQRVSSPELLARRIINKVTPGKIILLHDGYGTDHGTKEADRSTTVKAVSIIIDTLQAEGFRFVTVPELLNVPAYME
ncbi:MAG: glycosyltransferase [Chloroflexi bacterium]|nr:glycosyltransferase [Chloroflexota bacterium]